MEFSYGKGCFQESGGIIEGEIILGEHKLYLRDAQGDLAQSYVPLEKIEMVRLMDERLEVHVRPSLAYRYVALFSGSRKYIRELTRDIVQRRGFKKRFLKSEWYEVEQ